MAKKKYRVTVYDPYNEDHNVVCEVNEAIDLEEENDDIFEEMTQTFREKYPECDDPQFAFTVMRKRGVTVDEPVEESNNV